MNIDNIISDYKNKFIPKTSKQPSAAEQITLETRWTANIQRLIEFGNRKYLKNFTLRLEMDEDNDQQSFGEEKKVNVL
jgi:hypothetical protein